MRTSIVSFIALACASSIAAAQEEPPVDPAQDIRVTGFESRHLSEVCVSVGSDGSVIEGPSLPVGNGRWLECRTFRSATRATEMFSDNGVETCALGEATEWHGNTDFQVTTTVIDANPQGPWTVRADATNGPTTVEEATFLDFASAWSPGVYVRYKVIDTRPNPEAVNCSTFWGLPEGA